jgi:heavy metal translocating P-type ATPase
MKAKTPATSEETDIQMLPASGHEDRNQAGPQEVAETIDQEGQERGLETIDLVRIGFVALVALASGLHLGKRFVPFDGITLGATLIGGYPIFREAFENLRERRMTMELSMTIALGAALVIGEFFTALMIVLFVLIAEVLEGLNVGRGRRAISRLVTLLPHDAVVRQGNATREIQVSEINIGDVVVIKPGASVPVDGEVITGHSFIDQSTITGESLPVEKGIGARVYAGTVNQSGTLDVRTMSIGRDTAFGKIIYAVERAEQSRAPIQKTADRLAGHLVYFALGCALLTLLVTHNVRSTISVIIVAGACGVAAGTPLAILGAIGRSARQGAIVKGGLYLEILSVVDTIVLDKTGTLTLGNPVISEIRPAPGVTEQSVIEAAAIAERPSEHPLAKAILNLATQRSVQVTDPEQFAYTPGKGVFGTANGEEIVVGNRELLEERGIALHLPEADSGRGSEVLVARAGRFLGVLVIEDVIRPEAVEAVHAMRQLGLRTILLTGDRASIAEAVGKHLGVGKVGAELLPDEKGEWIKALLAEGRKVAMLGDGVNDAPALALASVGVAMGSGTDVARESADIVLLGNDLLKFVETVRIARRCKRIIMQNFIGTLAVDGIGVGLAAFGFLTPLFAVLIHVGSELIFILNSTRLLPAGTQGKTAVLPGP